MNTNSSDALARDLLERLARTPDVWPHNVDVVRQAILLIALKADDYRQQSFLDDRMLRHDLRGSWVPLAAAAEAIDRGVPARPLHFIFHTGHVGSTLLSRLLDETGAVLGLREPQSLRTLADLHDHLGGPDSLLSNAGYMALLRLFLKAWQRGYGDTRAVLVKATSSAGRLAPTLLEESPPARAVYLNLKAEPYLATLLGGANSALDLRGHGPARMRRLVQALHAPVAPLHGLSVGELAAMSWLTETLSELQCLEGFAGRVRAVDFDDLLANLAAELRTILDHFGLPTDAQVLARVAASPALTRYSKAPEHAYSPALRREILDDARRAHRDEIRRGLAWLEKLARSEPRVARVFPNGLA
ncbi:MAG: hypothetical protein R3E77_02820 [Steroidobacteraceae bacterium]